MLSILQFIVDIIAGLLGGVLLLRFWTNAIRVRLPDQIRQFVHTITDWLVMPLRRVVHRVQAAREERYAAAFADTRAGVMTRPQDLYLSQAAIAFAAVFAMGPTTFRNIAHVGHM